MIKTSKINEFIKPHKTNQKNTSTAYLLLMTGVDMTIGVALGMGIGYMIDKYMHTKPTFMILFILIGFIIGFKRVLK